MISPVHARTMAAYNAWMNERLYELCASLPDAERKRDRGAFFKSVHGTLNHLLYGDRAWMSRFTGGTSAGGGRPTSSTPISASCARRAPAWTA